MTDISAPPEVDEEVDVATQLRFAREGSLRVRCEFARNRYLAGEVELILARDESWQVREALAMRGGLGEECWEVLAGDLSDLVRSEVARNAVGDQQDRFVDDTSEMVRCHLGRNPLLRVGPQVLLSFDESLLVWKALRQSRRLLWSPLLNASFVQEFNPDFLWEQCRVSGADMEVARGLLPSWRGSVKDLIEASWLVVR